MAEESTATAVSTYPAPDPEDMARKVMTGTVVIVIVAAVVWFLIWNAVSKPGGSGFIPQGAASGSQPI